MIRLSVVAEGAVAIGDKLAMVPVTRAARQVIGTTKPTSSAVLGRLVLVATTTALARVVQMNVSTRHRDG